MTKFVMYRDNSAYRQLLAPVLAGKEDFELQIFPEGTDQEVINAWVSENADRIRALEKIYADNTCCLAGEKVPGKPFYSQWDGVTFERIELTFRRASLHTFRRLPGEESIAMVVRSLLAKETPSKILLITNNLGDHDLFESGWTEDREGKTERAIQKLHACLSDIAEQPVWYLDVSSYGFDAGVTITDEDIVWVFYDRHVLSKFEHRRDWTPWKPLPSSWRQFKVPIENLVADATMFGAELDSESFMEAVRNEIATW